jgi:uncharacterized protein (DUF2147 family)
MKVKLFFGALAILFLLPSMNLMAQVKADDVLGLWWNKEKDAHIKIYKENGKYYGKIVWLKEPIDEETGKPKLDKHNDDEALKKRPILGLVVLKDFVFDGDDEWEDGKIYDPKSGNTYSCYMEFPDEDNKDRLKIRGYIGISLLGRTDYWERVKE